MIAGGKCVKASGCVSQGIFGDNCVRMSTERLCLMVAGGKCVNVSGLGNLTGIAYCEEGENITCFIDY